MKAIFALVCLVCVLALTESIHVDKKPHTNIDPLPANLAKALENILAGGADAAVSHKIRVRANQTTSVVQDERHSGGVETTVKATVRGYDVTIPDTGMRPTPVDPLLANLTSLFDISNAEKDLMVASNTSGLNSTQLLIDWSMNLNSSAPMDHVANVTLPFNFSTGLNVSSSMPVLNFTLSQPLQPILPQDVVVTVSTNTTDSDANVTTAVAVEPAPLMEPTITFDEYMKDGEADAGLVSYSVFAKFDVDRSGELNYREFVRLIDYINVTGLHIMDNAITQAMGGNVSDPWTVEHYRNYTMIIEEFKRRIAQHIQEQLLHNIASQAPPAPNVTVSHPQQQSNVTQTIAPQIPPQVQTPTPAPAANQTQQQQQPQVAAPPVRETPQQNTTTAPQTMNPPVIPVEVNQSSTALTGVFESSLELAPKPPVPLAGWRRLEALDAKAEEAKAAQELAAAQAAMNEVLEAERQREREHRRAFLRAQRSQQIRGARPSVVVGATLPTVEMMRNNRDDNSQQQRFKESFSRLFNISAPAPPNPVAPGVNKDLESPFERISSNVAGPVEYPELTINQRVVGASWDGRVFDDQDTALLAPPSEDHVWSYAQKGRDWGGMCTQGRAQSPIRFNLNQTTIAEGPQIPEIALSLKYQNIQPGMLKMRHMGYGLMVASEGQMGYALNGREQTRMDVVQVAFHAPSEHAANYSKRPDGLFDMEMQIAHRDPVTGKILIVSQLFEVPRNESVSGENLWLENALMWSSLPKKRGETTVLQNGFNLAHADLLHRGSWQSPYFTYQGSLTVPPCNEGVEWKVMKETQWMSRQQVLNINMLFKNRRSFAFGRGNNRPVQPRYNRRVILSS